MKTAKILLILTLLTLITGLVSGSEEIEITEFELPETAETGEEINAEVRADVDDKHVEIMGLDWEEGTEEKSCTELAYCEREWSFEIENPGTIEVTANAEDETGYTDQKTREISVEEHNIDLNLEQPLDEAEISSPYSFEWSSSHPSEDVTHSIYIKKENDEGSLWDSENKEAEVGKAKSYWLDRTLSPEVYSWGIEAETESKTERKRDTFKYKEEDKTGEIKANVKDDQQKPVENAKVTAMDLNTSNFAVKTTDKRESSESSNLRNVGDSKIGFELNENNLRTYAEYHSGYTQHDWNNFALKSEDQDQIVFRYDLSADNRQSTYTKYAAEQNIGLESGDKEVTIILTHNGETVDSVTSKISVPDEHAFSKTKDSSGTSFQGRDRRTGNSPSIPTETKYTDESGKADFTVSPGRYAVTGSKKGYRSDRKNVKVESSEKTQADLQLQKIKPEDKEPKDPGDEEREKIEINSVEMPTSVCRGDEVHARIRLSNTGTEDLDFQLSASGASSDIDRQYFLERGQTNTVVLAFPTDDVSGNQRFSFNTGFDSTERTVQVRNCERAQEKTSLSASIKPSSQIRIGQSIRVTGIAEGSWPQEVDISIDNTLKQSVSTGRDGRFRSYIVPDSVGKKDVVIETEKESLTRKIEVLPTVNVHSLTAPEKEFEDQRFEVCADVESQTTPKVILKKNGDVIDSKDASGEVCFERTESPGKYTYTVQGLNRGASSSKSATVRVLEAGDEADSFPDRIASVQSGSGMVKTELYNIRDRRTTYDVSLEGLPEDWTDQSRESVSLAKGQRDTNYIYVSPNSTGSFDATLRVEANDELVYSEEIEVWAGGKDRREPLLDRIWLWLKNRFR